MTDGTAKLRIPLYDTGLWVEFLPPGERATYRAVYRGRDGDDLIGIVEHVGINLRGGRGTRYGWRPAHSGWTASRLSTQKDAAQFLEASRRR